MNTSDAAFKDLIVRTTVENTIINARTGNITSNSNIKPGTNSIIDAAASGAHSAPGANSSIVTNNRATHSAGGGGVGGGGGGAHFPWDSRIQGSILAAFFYGYVITQIPGGYLTRRCGGKVVFAAGVAGSSLLALLSPLAAAGGWETLWAARFLQGVAQVR